MKLRNESTMYIVIYMSLSFNETFCLYDENDDYSDFDLIPFISISPKKENISIVNDCFKSCKTTLNERYSDRNLQYQYEPFTAMPARTNNCTENIRKVLQFQLNDTPSVLFRRLKENISMGNDCFKSCKTTLKGSYSNRNLHYVHVTKIPTRTNNSTRNIIRTFLQSELNDSLSALYRRLKENITSYSRGNQAKESSEILKIEKNEFHNERLNQKFSSYDRSNSKVEEKLVVSGQINTQQLKNDDFGAYAINNFFDSLLSLLSYLNPKLVNALNASIKKFQEYNVIKRDSSNDASSNTSDGTSKTLNTILCNCDYCRTGKPDTLLYIVSGKKLSNNITYHKLTSINRSKTSSKYRARTTDNSSHQTPYPPAYHNKPTNGNSLDAPIDEKVIKSNEPRNGFHEQLPVMKMVPVSRDLGMKYVPAEQNKFYRPLNIPIRQVIEPKSHRYRPLYIFGNNPILKHTDAENKKANYYDKTYYSKNSIEPLNFLYQSITEPIQFSNFLYNGRSRSIFDEKLASFFDEATEISTFGNLNRTWSVTDVSKISMETSEEIPIINRNQSLKNDNEQVDTQIKNFDKIDVSDKNVVSLTTEENFTTVHPSPLIEQIDNSYLKNMFHKKDFKKILLAAANDRNIKFLSPATKAAFKIDPGIYKSSRIMHEMNTVSNGQSKNTGPLEKSIVDIIGKLLDGMGARNSTCTVTKHIQTTKNYILLSDSPGNNSNNNIEFKNSSISKKLDKSEYLRPLSLQTGLFDSTACGTYPTVQPPSTVNTTILTTTIPLNTSVNKIEPYVNYDLYLRNLVGETNIDDKIICS